MSAQNATADAPPIESHDPKPPLPAWIRAKFAIARGFVWAWACCFSLKGLYLFGQVFGTCEWLINYKRRKRFRKNVEAVFGQPIGKIDNPSMRWACLKQFIRIRCDKLIYLIFDKLPKERILARITVVGRDRWDEALKRGKGLYAATGHTGTVHLMGLGLMLMGYPVVGVRDPKEGALRRYIQRKHEKRGSELRSMRILFSGTYPREIFRCLQDGYVLGSSLDVARSRGSHLRTVTVTLFGQQRQFLVGPIQIALRCGSPIFVLFIRSLKDFHYEFILNGPLVDPDTATDQPEVHQEVMQRYADHIADFLARYPDHISRT